MEVNVFVKPLLSLYFSAGERIRLEGGQGGGGRPILMDGKVYWGGIGLLMACQEITHFLRDLSFYFLKPFLSVLSLSQQ